MTFPKNLIFPGFPDNVGTLMLVEEERVSTLVEEDSVNQLVEGVSVCWLEEILWVCWFKNMVSVCWLKEMVSVYLLRERVSVCWLRHLGILLCVSMLFGVDNISMSRHLVGGDSVNILVNRYGVYWLRKI